MPSVAFAGGLVLPGDGVISSSRAGAALVSADDAEAIPINPAGIAQSHGTKITLGINAISYGMKFRRTGDYNPIPEESTSYAGMRFPEMTNAAHPPLGFGSYQPVPLIGIVSDLGGILGGRLHAGFAVYAPQAYPFRDLNNVNGQPYYTKGANGAYGFPSDLSSAPPPTRYDIVAQQATIILPSIAVAYSIPKINVDVGGRLSLGYANLESTSAVWGLANYEEYIKQDGIVTIKATDSLVVTYGFGATYHALKDLDISAQWSAPITLDAKGEAYSQTGSAVQIAGGQANIVAPGPTDPVRCAQGGTAAALKACVKLMAVPMTAGIGGRWKFRDHQGRMRGDVELNLGWEHWGKHCSQVLGSDPNCLDPSNYHVTIDGVAEVASPTPGQPPLAQVPLVPQYLQHDLQDTYSIRVGGSYIIPVVHERDAVIVRGGVGYDSAAAKQGWERLDLDGAARTTLALGASYRFPRVSIDAGFSFIYEGTRTQGNGCMPMAANQGCGPGGAPLGFGQQAGASPINPIIPATGQFEDPVDQGTITSHYVELMLGASTWF